MIFVSFAAKGLETRSCIIPFSDLFWILQFSSIHMIVPPANYVVKLVAKNVAKRTDKSFIKEKEKFHVDSWSD